MLKNKKNLPAGRRGFTLIELLVVISIIGLLATIVLVSLNSARAKARDTRRISDLHQIVLALEMYYSDYGYYPPSGCGWDCNGYNYSSWGTNWIPELVNGGYMSVVPVDPQNSGGPPWATDGFTYSYGNVGKTTYPAQYDLTAHLETAHDQRCELKCYRWYFSNEQWCSACGGVYSNQIFEASPN